MELGGKLQVEASKGGLFAEVEEAIFVLLGWHPLNPLSCKQRREQRANDTAAINVIERGPKLSLSGMAFYFTAGRGDINDLGGGQLGAKMVRQWNQRGTT